MHFVFFISGCDILAPSDMMDGRVDCIANILKQNGLRNKVSLFFQVSLSLFHSLSKSGCKSILLLGWVSRVNGY